MISLRIIDQSKAEIRAAANHLRDSDPRVASRFITAVFDTIELALRFPKLGRKIAGDFRRRSVRGFPYSVVYVVEHELLIVIAVPHHRQRPDYWLNRPH